MQKLQILNRREKKPIIEQIKTKWGCEFKTDLVFLKSSKEKIYLITRDLERIDTSKLRVDSMGVYFGSVKDGDLRLSMEGSQMIGPEATKNVLEIDHDNMRSLLKGNDLELEKMHADLKGYVILKHGNDFLGTGKLRGNEVLNFIPKNRRILCND